MGKDYDFCSQFTVILFLLTSVNFDPTHLQILAPSLSDSDCSSFQTFTRAENSDPDPLPVLVVYSTELTVGALGFTDCNSNIDQTCVCNI